MERTIDRTSYRRSSRIETKKEEIINEKTFSYLKVFLNQVIVSLLIIVLILTARYFDYTRVDEWINGNMSGGYEINEIYNILENKFNFNKNVQSMYDISGDSYSFFSGDFSGDSGEISGENIFQTAVEGINQMDIDAKEIKETYDLILPVHGTITSKFGCRISDSDIVSSYHTGLDIGADVDTKILAAHSGVVTMAKAYSSYGNCIMIQSGDLVTVYAHCSSINVSENQKVNKGDFIGKVGMTGNATGPHLHLEFRYQGRYVNPENIFGEV